MIITDRFVYIHMPKTGGTFVTEVLRRLHRVDEPPPKLRQSLRRILESTIQKARGLPAKPFHPYGALVDSEPKHGTCHDVPREHREKAILSSIRSPFDWYVSQFEFSWWKRTFKYHPEPYPTPVGYAIEQALPGFISDHPHFPNVTFEEFLELCRRASNVYNRDLGTDLGLYTQGFARYFFRQPAEALKRMNRDYILSNTHKPNMFDVSFLRTDRLNQELCDFLYSMGYHQEDLAFLPDLGRILPMGIGRREDQHWEKYYTSDTKELIRAKDWALFEFFPEFDI